MLLKLHLRFAITDGISELNWFRGCALVLTTFLMISCATGDDAIMRQARDECQRQTHADVAAFDACVERRSDVLYGYWMKRLQTRD